MLYHTVFVFIWLISLSIIFSRSTYMLKWQNFIIFIVSNIPLHIQIYMFVCVLSCFSHVWLLCPWDSLGRNTGMGCHALLQGIFPTQGSMEPALASRFFTNSTTWEAYVYIPHLLYPCVYWWTLELLPYLSYLGLLIINSAALNIGMHVSLQISVFIFFWIYTQE